MPDERTGPTERQGRWALRATFVGGAALACLAAGALMRHDVLLLVGAGLMLGAYALGVVADAFAGRGERPVSPRAHFLAGVIAFTFVTIAATLLSAVVAIFVGFGAFRWMAACLPLAAAWLLLSGAIGRLARRLARGHSHLRSKSSS